MGRIASGKVEVAERVYKGISGDPKTERSLREAAIPAGAGCRYRPVEFISRDNFLRRNIHSKLEKICLGWVTFQVLRRTQASLSHKEGIDPKVAADQRGHGIGLALDTYTVTDLESRRRAVTTLEIALGELHWTGEIQRPRLTRTRGFEVNKVRWKN